jgi:hypothetical protein
VFSVSNTISAATEPLAISQKTHTVPDISATSGSPGGLAGPQDKRVLASQKGNGNLMDVPPNTVVVYSDIG